MTVNNCTNQNPNKTGLYTLAGTAIGGGLGVGAAYITKPYLKNEEPKDIFLREIRACVNKNSVEKINKLKEIKDTESLINLIGKDKFERFEDTAKELIKQNDIAAAKESAKAYFVYENMATNSKVLFNDFVTDQKIMAKEEISLVRKAIRKTRGKYALLFGGIGALILGTVGFLCSRNKQK